MLSHFIIKIRFSNIKEDKSHLICQNKSNYYLYKNFNYFE